jgi:hypothetical protein
MQKRFELNLELFLHLIEYLTLLFLSLFSEDNNYGANKINS